MKLLNNTKFTYAPTAGRLNFPNHSLTHIIKATFDLVPNGKAKIADDQLLPTGDEFFPDDEEQTGSLFYESDFAYIKPKADVLLVGKCHTPKQQAMSACPVSLSVGEYSKELAVYGNRFWKKVLINAEMSEPHSFTEMDLRYERSFGGKDHKNNPVGRGACKEDVTIADNVLPVPNIQDPEDMVTSPFQKKFPAGFGALNRTWRHRSEKLGTYNNKYQKTRWPWFPDDMQQDYFNAAPPDQQFKGFLKGDESLVFENLHPKLSQYKSQLPGLRLRCFIRTVDSETKKRHFEEVDLNLDTLWVDMEAEKLVLVWRGWHPILSDEFEELAHVFLMNESLTEKPASIEKCYEFFCKARDEEEAEFAGKKPKKEVAEKKDAKNIKLKVPPATGAAAAADQAVAEGSVTTAEEQAKMAVEIQQQVDEMLANTGLDINALPEELLAEFKAKQQAIIDKVTEADPDNFDNMQLEQNQAMMADELAKLDLDIDKLPPLTEKAKQEQLKLLKEIGMEDVNLQDMDASTEQLWTLMAAVFPKMGVDPENLTPLIESNQEKLAELKANMQPVFAANKNKSAKNKSAKNKQDEQFNATQVKVENIKKRAVQKESFTGEVFDEMDLSGIDFSDCDLKEASFVGGNLSQANFTNTDISKTIFRGANLTQANMCKARAQAADFTQATLNECLAEEVDFSQALFTQAKLQYARLSCSTFENANLAKSSCFQAQFKETKLDKADFNQAMLTGADFTSASLCDTSFEKVVANDSMWNAVKGSHTVFREADLTNADFSSVELPFTDFSGAKLTNANFSQSKLSNIFMEKVKADQVNLSECELFKLRASSGSDFSEAKLMHSTINESNWADANLSNANFTSASLQAATLIKANLTDTQFYEGNLKFSRFNGADLTRADMCFVNMMQGSFEKANLTEAVLSGSNLYEVEFLDAILEQTNVEKANVDGTKLDN